MRRRFLGLFGFAVLLAAGFAPLGAAVLVTEIMYNPPRGGDHEYIELHNSGPAAVDLSGWSFTEGVMFTFPAGTSLAAGAYSVVCGSRAAFLAAYPSVPAAAVLGELTGALANDGERLTLSNASGVSQQTVAYLTDPPWELLADGFGASLERLCLTSDPDDPANWRASPVPSSPEAFGGSPAAPNAVQACPPAAPPRPRVYISEILYHPVLEQDFVENHEFVELHNAEASAVSLAGWRLAGAIDYAFPAGASIGAGEHRAVAKNKAALAAVASYGLNVGSLFGDYARELDNGGEKVALIGASGQGVDSVTYDDDFPWPAGADALGADDDFLPASLLPLSNHRYRGISLERVSFEVPSSEVANWAPSPLDGATPGRANASARAAPLPIVADMLVQGASTGSETIRATDQVLLQVRFAPASPSGPVEVQHFVDDVAVSNEPLTTAALRDDGTGGDLISGDGIYSAVLPARAANSIVRYRVRADLEPGGTGVEVVSPRPSDPYAYHAYFVSPVVNTTTRVYHLFISPANWTAMWDNIQGGRASGCTARTAWDAKVPAVFVYNGRVSDVRARYQGSRYNRSNGPNLSSWPYPGPARPSPVRALSWRITLPRYAQLDGATVVTLNKLTQGCPGYDAGVGYRLFEAVDIPSPNTRYARLHVNGGYYHYMIQYERPDEDMIRRYVAEQAAKYPERPKEEIGHLFKSAGCNCDEGPYGWGDARRLFASCGYPVETRYAYTYDRKTWSWDTYDELMLMIDELHAARASLPDTTALRDYFETFWNLDLLLSYVAVMNWSVPFDDMFQNHFFYQRRSDGKWLISPWDLDLNFGGWKGAGASLYMGEQNDPDNRSGWWHYVKDSLLKSYRTELEARLLSLTNTVLHPDEVSRLVDAVTAQANPAEAAQAPAGVACSFSGDASNFKAFARDRHRVVNDQLSAVRADAGPDQTVVAGAVVQFDARASRPDPGPGVTYAWSNGMAGDFPTAIFGEPGAYVITLTITVNGIPYQDSVRITVVEPPSVACAEEGGQVTVEAESFYLNDAHGTTSTSWVERTAQAGYSGAGYMQAAQPGARTTFPSGYATTAPELKYALLFQTTGAYRVWIRAFSSSQDADSVHVGLDGNARDESFAQRFTLDASNYTWSSTTRGGGPQELTVSTPGVHLLSLWVRESNQVIDKIVMTRSTTFTPTGQGPAESEKVPVAPANPVFVRGDANRDGVVDISDALAVLFFLFRGSSSLQCEDHGDTDDSGALQVTDATVLLAYLFKGGAPPAAPFPAAGRDATPDAFACGE
ncbi:MAG: lamin tail domain-containing protein [Planctomycetes bacterium]|nr:lamin tail domain-containing protein [Planctomycetota bacterium]